MIPALGIAFLLFAGPYQISKQHQRSMNLACSKKSPNLFGKAQDLVTKAIFGKEDVTMKEEFYDCVDRDMEGNQVKMEQFKGNVLLAVNVASKWGLTNQNYTELRKLLDDYKGKPFKVLGFPCNQFGGQEPGTHEDILNFVDKYGLRDDVVWFEKADVNGANAREVFSFLKKTLPADDGTSDIRWNFSKFLIDADGVPTKRYGPQLPPLDIKSDIQALLRKAEAN